MSGSEPPKSIQATEVFRFVCGRPAIKNPSSIKVRLRRVPPRDGGTRPHLESASSTSALGISSGFTLAFTKKIAALADALDLDDDNVEIGRNIELKTDTVRRAIRTAFGSTTPSNLVKSEDWIRDEIVLDRRLIELWQAATDPRNTGPRVARYRQLYDLVRQAGDDSTGTEDHEPFWLKGLELSLGEQFSSDGDDGNDDVNNDENETRPRRLVARDLGAQTDEETDEEKAKELKAQIRHLIQGLHILNSNAILEYRTIDSSKPTEFLIEPKWVDELLPKEAQETVHASGIPAAANPPNPLMAITWHYDKILAFLADTIATGNALPKFKTGLFSIGPFNLEMVKPWTVVLSQNDETTSPNPGGKAKRKVLPDPKRSLVKLTGVGDLLVVRDHIWKYVGGEIGAIQNVLKSEWLIRETKKLDRTEVVDFTSSATQTEEDREETTTTRFALSKETNDLIKQDSATKAGVSTSAYGPYVSIKADFSTAQNNASESSNKVASQYAQDLTSRASSKIIEKTVKSITKTTISQFQENYRHEFKNTDVGDANISGVYQWVNKVSQCQMWNYGKRLLIDITIPEPGAFLMVQSGDAGPSLENPPPLTESATDLNEANYSGIAARYQATGLKPPDPLLMSISKSFKADPMSSGGPKLGGGDPWHLGGTASLNLDLAIPAGYLVYAAKIQVGIRTGHKLSNWNKFEGQVYPEFTSELAETNPYISVAGIRVKAGTTVKDEVDAPTATDQDTTGTVYFKQQLLKDTIAVSIVQDFCLSLTGTIQICCVRDPSSYAQWQQQTYDSIMTAYNKAKMDYERSKAETAVGTLTVTSGNNPLENTNIISTELKKAAISFITTQNYKVFGLVTADSTDQIPEVDENDMHDALRQGNYADFFEKAFEWENMTYGLYPYFWAKRSTWRDRMGFQSPDPTFSAFIKAGMAKVTIPVRLGFGLEAIHFLETGKIWQKGPVSTLAGSEYYSIAQEILAAEAQPDEVKVSDPWYTIIPTELVQLRKDDILPRFKTDSKGVWVERNPGDADWDE